LKRLLLILLPLSLFSNENNKSINAENLYLQHACNSCHGMYGGGIGSAPKLQGQKAALLLKRLKALQKGNPRTPFGGIMISFAKSLDTNQTIAMAQYLSTLTANKEEERYDEEYEPSGDGGS